MTKHREERTEKGVVNDDYLHLVRGPCEATMPRVLATCQPVALAHINWDIRSPVAA